MKTRKLVIIAMVAAMSTPLAAYAGGGHHDGGDKDFCDPDKITTDSGLTLKELFSLFRDWYEDHYS